MTRDLGTYSTIRRTSRRPLRRTRYSKSTVFTLNVPDMPWLGLGPPGRCRAKSRHRCLAFCLCSLDRFQSFRSFPLHLLACERYQMPPPTASWPAENKESITKLPALASQTIEGSFPGLGCRMCGDGWRKLYSTLPPATRLNFCYSNFLAIACESPHPPVRSTAAPRGCGRHC